MANDSKNDDFPTIRLDDEDRRDYQQNKRRAGHTASHTIPSGNAAAQTVVDDDDEDEKRGGASTVLVILVLLLALGGLGGCYYLYTLLQQQQAVAQDAESRLAELERKLSATDEEMGESTVALQVKVNELSEKSKETWEQVDKLWASAWRRNQKEITELSDKVSSMQKELTASVSRVSEDVSTHQSRLTSIKNQLASLADEVLAFNVSLEQINNDKQSQQQSVRNVNDKLSVLEKRNNTLNSRISALENDLRDIATKVVSGPQNNGGSTGGGSAE